MKVILISGKAESGKDTFATMLKEELNGKDKKVLVIKYADILKFVCKEYFDWDGVKDEHGRHLLQFVGTDIVRKKDNTTWIKCVKLLVNGLSELYDYVLIPDVRFENEITEWFDTEYEVTTVRVERFNEDGSVYQNHLTEEQKSHSSETELDDYNFDFIIDNCNLEDLRGSAQILIENV